MSPTLEKLGTGFLFTEGPVWHPTGKFLLFSDMPGDHMRRWSATGGIQTFRKPCHMSNGLTYDRRGRLVACEPGKQCLAGLARAARVLLFTMSSRRATRRPALRA